MWRQSHGLERKHLSHFLDPLYCSCEAQGLLRVPCDIENIDIQTTESE